MTGGNRGKINYLRVSAPKSRENHVQKQEVGTFQAE